jgi:FlaA1/EpsC-like NDP-sugar epimerase
MAVTGRNGRLVCGVFSKDLERRHPMRTRQLHRKERMEVLLEDKNAVIYGAGGRIGGGVAQTFAREGTRIFLTPQGGSMQ